MTVQPSLLFIFGLGYTAKQLALRRVSEGWSVGGTVRSEKSAQDLIGKGIGAQVWPGNDFNIPVGSHWVISVPPNETGCPVAAAFGDQAGQAASITYLSTTGVYGDLGGGWAFEWSALNPQSDRARARVKAEGQWQALAKGQARLVRLPGIYGPGRSAFDRLKAGQAEMAVKPGQVFSRVHVEDLVGGLVRLLDRPSASGVFHFCDDEPAPPEAVIVEAARLLGMPAPSAKPVDEAALSDMARSFYAECKRVSNARAKAELGWRPKHVSYREGLSAILAAETELIEQSAG